MAEKDADKQNPCRAESDTFYLEASDPYTCRNHDRKQHNGMSYSHNSNDRKNWCIKFSGNTYNYIYEWIQNNRGRLEEMQKFAVWDGIFADMGSRYERIWSREEELQGYLNQ